MSEIHSCSYYCTRPACVLRQRDDLREKMLTTHENVSALTRYNETAANPEIYTGDPLERLRIFCAFAMGEQDWVDAEPFFDAVESHIDVLEQAEPVRPSVAEPVVDDLTEGNPSY